MSNDDLIARIESSTQMAKELCVKLEQYQKMSVDPDSTLSLPDLNYMCKLSEELVKNLENLSSE